MSKSDVTGENDGVIIESVPFVVSADVSSDVPAGDDVLKLVMMCLNFYDSAETAIQ